MREPWSLAICNCRGQFGWDLGDCIEALDCAAAEGAQGRGQSPSAQLVCALPAQAVLAAADTNIQRGVHADEAHLCRHKSFSIAIHD